MGGLGFRIAGLGFGLATQVEPDPLRAGCRVCVLGKPGLWLGVVTSVGVSVGVSVGIAMVSVRVKL